eukprot:TRINITY_DN1265_c0_g1_i2.p1 TRINITY_DN1265_c0_g1~~TRINITY_DN1265_c0_g1_i2.p1  ORF type:complete len:679 (-),score=121.35 TRINITY_DN1265_c0_g1_i2:83-2119(-)
MEVCTDTQSVKRSIENNSSFTLSTKMDQLPLMKYPLGSNGAKLLSEALKNNQTITFLDLYHTGIGDDEVVLLCDSLMQNSLKSLKLEKNSIGDKGANAISEMMKCNTTLTTLYLSGNMISPIGIKKISEFLTINTTLAKLYLSQNDVNNDGSYYLAHSLGSNTKLFHLELSCTNVGDEGAKHFELLSANKGLTVLDLSWNQIGSTGAIGLANLLKQNSTITELYLSVNHIGDEASIHFSDAIKTNTTLIQLYLAGGENKMTDVSAKLFSESLHVNATLCSLEITWEYVDDSFKNDIQNSLKKNNYFASKLKELKFKMETKEEQIIKNFDDKLKLTEDSLTVKSIKYDEKVKILDDKIRDYEALKENIILAGEIDYSKLAFIDRNFAVGTYGYIQTASYSHPVTVAVKFLHEHLENDAKIKKSFIEEIHLTMSVRHPNIAHSIGYGIVDDKWFLCSKLEQASLSIVLEKMKLNFRKWKPIEVIKILTDICKGMEFLHSKNIYHRDMHMGNFLVSSDFTVKISDFGVAKQVDKMSGRYSYSTPVGAAIFRAPEVDLVYNYKCDIWSFGIVISSVISNKSQPDTPTIDDIAKVEEEMMSKYSGEKKKISTFLLHTVRREACLNNCSSEYLMFKKLMLDCMKLDDKERPQFKEILVELVQSSYGLDESTPNIEWIKEEWRNV